MTLGAVAAAVLLPSVVMAQTAPQGVYFEGRGGAVFLMDSDLGAAGIPPGAELSFDTGYMAEGAIGYADAGGLRGEVAVGYRKNDFDEASAPGFVTATVDGDITATTVMANGYMICILMLQRGGPCISVVG